MELSRISLAYCRLDDVLDAPPSAGLEDEFGDELMNRALELSTRSTEK